MAGTDCGDVVNRKFDENSGCGVGESYFVLANEIWWGVFVEML